MSEIEEKDDLFVKIVGESQSFNDPKEFFVLNKNFQIFPAQNSATWHFKNFIL